MKRHPQKGAALIELAVSLPFVVMLFIGLLDLTIFFYQRTQIQLTLHTAAQSVIRNRAAYAETGNLERLATELKKDDVSFRLLHEDGLLRIDASRPIAPMLRPLAAAGYPSQVVARAFIRLK
jgi:type II secretory pathway component PulK